MLLFRQVGCHSPAIFAESIASERTAWKDELQFIQLARLEGFLWKNFGNSAAALLILARNQETRRKVPSYQKAPRLPVRGVNTS